MEILMEELTLLYQISLFHPFASRENGYRHLVLAEGAIEKV